MSEAIPGAVQERRREILRQASVALQGRLVTLWRVSDRAEVVPEATNLPHPPHHGTKLDLDATLRRWGTPIIQGSRWVGCQLGDEGPWCIAPVRVQPAAPPPGGVERRGRERMTLELAGLCLGHLDNGAEGAKQGGGAAAPLADVSSQPGLIAHEVANPITAALVTLDGCLSAVREATDLEPDLRAKLLGDLAAVAEGMERAVGFLRAVRDRARGALARSERFDAAQVVQSCVRLERPLAKKRGVALRLTSVVETVFLHGDPNAMFQMLSNLIRNGVDASSGAPGSGTESAVEVTLAQKGEALHVTVVDHGSGIASEHLGRIFEPGFTTKEVGAGSGMGLSVVRDVTQNMFGGAIKVESVLGAGTVVALTLPIPRQRSPRRQ
ncbi:MAG: sensor histidine kinase [Gemmatimonadales bacterium]